MTTPENTATVRFPLQRGGSREGIPAALLTVPEAMSALRLSRATTYDLIRAGELLTVKVGRCRADACR